ncbi:MAG: hypothetical protein NUW21_10000, partial [Elusimicrobia bacterium]|nr:hypothetical protein [Elusimicrobiota bacterium]
LDAQAKERREKALAEQGITMRRAPQAYRDAMNAPVSEDERYDALSDFGAGTYGRRLAEDGHGFLGAAMSFGEGLGEGLLNPLMYVIPGIGRLAGAAGKVGLAATSPTVQVVAKVAEFGLRGFQYALLGSVVGSFSLSALDNIGKISDYWGTPEAYVKGGEAMADLAFGGMMIHGFAKQRTRDRLAELKTLEGRGGPIDVKATSVETAVNTAAAHQPVRVEAVSTVKGPAGAPQVQVKAPTQSAPVVEAAPVKAPPTGLKARAGRLASTFWGELRRGGDAFKETNRGELKASDVKPATRAEANSGGAKALDAKSAELKVAEVKTAPKAVEVKAAEVVAPEAKAPKAPAAAKTSVEANAVQTKVDAKGVKAVEAKAPVVKAEVKAVEVKAVEAKAPIVKAEVKAPIVKAEVKAVEVKAVEAKGPKAKADVRAVEAKGPKAKADVKAVEAKAPKARADAKSVETKTAKTKAELRNAAKAEVKTEAPIEAKRTAKAEVRTETKSRSRSKAKSEARPEAKSEAKGELKDNLKRELAKKDKRGRSKFREEGKRRAEVREEARSPRQEVRETAKAEVAVKEKAGRFSRAKSWLGEKGRALGERAQRGSRWIEKRPIMRLARGTVPLPITAAMKRNMLEPDAGRNRGGEKDPPPPEKKELVTVEEPLEPAPDEESPAGDETPGDESSGDENNTTSDPDAPRREPP